MSDELRRKWNHRHGNASLPTPACTVLQEQAARLPHRPGKALDLACGLGGNAIFLAERGFHCDAWDISDVALQQLSHYAHRHQLAIPTTPVDLEKHSLYRHSFDVITVSYFLYRPLLPKLALALKPGGLLFYQTFLASSNNRGGPTNPNFFLHKNELPSQYQNLRLCYYEERSEDTNLGHSGADIALMVAQSPLC